MPPSCNISIRAVEEVVADACELMLRDSKAIETLAKENQSLFEKIRDWLKKFAEDVRKAFQGKEARHAEATAMLDYVDELVELWDKGLLEARESGGETKKGSSTKFSYAGRKARTADYDQLLQAEKMERAGKSNEEIRQTTGWFKGMDGFWRFEVNDSAVKLNLDGNIIVEYNGKQGFRAGDTLGNILDHPALFSAYPDLEKMYVQFKALSHGEKGYYSRGKNKIVINSQYISKPDEIKKTLLHEIQHAIQQTEGFAGGANEEYWRDRIATGFDPRTKEVRKKLDEARQQFYSIKFEKPDFYAAMMKLEEMTPTVPRGKVDFETLEQIEPDPPEWEAFDAEREALEEQYGDMEVWDFMDLVYHIKMYEGDKGRSPVELYYSTAGEIEARDTAKRIDMSEEQRKNTRPDIDREDVVFAEGYGLSFYMIPEGTRVDADKYIEERHGLLLNDVKMVVDEIKDMPPIKLSGKEFQKGGNDNRKLKEKLNDYFSEIKSVNRFGFGEILLNRAGVSDSTAHGYGPLKVAAFAAIPELLKNGKIFGPMASNDHQYETYMFCSPVEYEGSSNGNFYVGAYVIKDNNTRRYKLHEVLTIKKEDHAPFQSEAAEKTAATPDASSPDASIRNSEPNVKKSLRETEDNAIRFSLREPVEETKDLIAVHKFSRRDSSIYLSPEQAAS